MQNQTNGTNHYLVASDFDQTLEDILKWNARQIRELFASYGLALHDWDKIRTDWLTFHKAPEREGAGKIALVH